jgi:ribosome-binding factor A
VLEIAADTLDRLDDDRLGLLTIQDVYVDSELDQAKITYVQSGQPTEDDDEFAEALDEARRAIKREVGRQAHIRRTPEVILTEDQVVETASRVEEILRELRENG